MEFEDFKVKFVDQLIDEDDNAIEKDTMFRNLSSWDSLTAMAVIAMIEDDYGVKIAPEEFKKLNTVEDIFNLIVTDNKI